MQEKKRQFDKLNKVYLPGISRLLIIFGISLLFIQYLIAPVFAQTIEYYDGYNVISYDDGSKDIISGAFNFLRWDGVWRPNEELNISNGSWPYSYSENTTTANIKVEDTTLNIPKANTKFITNQNSISQVLTFSKSELKGKEKSINLTSAFVGIPYTLTSKKLRTKYEDKSNIIYGRLNFKAGKDHITIHDDTLRNYTEDGEVFQDYTYLFEDDYDFVIENGEIRLKFEKKALDKLVGNVTIEIHTWYVNFSPNNWGNVAFYQTTTVKATNNVVELGQKVDDYKFYTRLDEGSGRTIHNEKKDYIPTGYLNGTTTSTTYRAGKYGKAIYFNGLDTGEGNRIEFDNHADIRLPNDFTISLFLYHTGYNNVDTDILRKGSSSTATAWSKLEVGSGDPYIPNNIYGFVEKSGSKVTLADTMLRRDGNWHFIALTRQGTTCKLMIDGAVVSSTTPQKPCKTNTANTAQLSIGAKDSAFPDDYIEGLIDEVKMYDRTLTTTELSSNQKNEHYPTGTITRDLSNPAIIPAGYEIKELGCHGTWDNLITRVDIEASTDNIIWQRIRDYADPRNNINYTLTTPNNYKYFRCLLSTADLSKTPILTSMGANIDRKSASYINGTIKDNSSSTPIAGVKVSTNTGVSKMTNAAGFYSFAVTSGTTYNITATLNPTYSPQSAFVTAVQGTVVKDFSLVKKPTGTITGRVNKA